MIKDFFISIKNKTGGLVRKHWKSAAVFIVLVLVAANFFPRAGRKGGGQHEGPGAGEGQENKILYWTCSMHPQIKLPKKGLCPICAMELIPVYESGADSGGPEVSLTLSRTAQDLAEIETAEVKYQEVSNEVRMVGKVGYDETRLSYISAWIPGRIDRLFVDFTGTKVAKGGPLIKIYSPELLAAQEEYLQAVKNLEASKESRLSVIRDTAKSTLESSKEKLRLYGINEKQVDDLLKRGVYDEHMIITSPVAGTVIHKNGFEGMYVKTGDRIYTIADLSKVWLFLDAYESDIQWLRYGQDVKIEAESFPGEVFHGKVAFIDPIVDEKTRTIKLRVNVDNTDEKLKPGMFVRATIHAVPGEGGKVLVIPKTAPLITGKRAVVYVENETKKATVKRYEGREVILGPRAGDYYIVLSGLNEGERVVSKGNFKIDSALQIQAKPSMMNPAGYYSQEDNVLSQDGGTSGESADGEVKKESGGGAIREGRPVTGHEGH